MEKSDIFFSFGSSSTPCKFFKIIIRVLHVDRNAKSSLYMLTSSGEREEDLDIKDFNNIGISTQSCQKQKSLHAFTIKLIELFFLEE